MEPHWTDGYYGDLYYESVADLLTESKHNLRVYDALLYEESYRKRVDFVCGDVRDASRLLPHLKWADAVIWLAALFYAVIEFLAGKMGFWDWFLFVLITILMVVGSFIDNIIINFPIINDLYIID